MTKKDIINSLQFTIDMTMYNHITGEFRQEYELNDMDKTTVDACKEAIALLKHKPRTGRWIDNHNGTISCDYCYAWFHIDDRYSYMKHCPNCGAKMESEENRE